jgi:dTDP-4-dehydrorhamnose reductase
MKILFVTGGNGLLGCKLVELAGRSYHVVFSDIQEKPSRVIPNGEYVRCDITNRKSLKDVFGNAKPDAVFHAAAFTDVDGCETQKDTAWKVNVFGTENVASVCRKFGVRLIHVSTDYVFDGNAGPYSETDVPNPISYYGKTKLEAEKIVQSVLPDAVIVRTIVMYGFAPFARNNFVTGLVQKLSRREPVNIVTDQYGNATLADDLVRAMLLLYEKNAKGIYHATGEEWLNRFDFAVKIAEVFGLDKSLISPTTSDAFKQPAPRPLRSGLKTDKIRAEFGFVFSSVSEGLRRVRDQMVQAGIL